MKTSADHPPTVGGAREGKQPQKGKPHGSTLLRPLDRGGFCYGTTPLWRVADSASAQADQHRPDHRGGQGSLVGPLSSPEAQDRYDALMAGFLASGHPRLLRPTRRADEAQRVAEGCPEGVAWTGDGVG